MTTARRDFKTSGVVLRKTPYKETSLILEVFTQHLGRVSVIAKGARREKQEQSGLLDLLNELELVLHKSPQSKWFILTSAKLIHSWYRDIDFNNGLLLQACIEVFRQLEIQREDNVILYDLMIRYFQYIHKQRKNGIAVFWRFILRILNIYGIDIDIDLCQKCGNRGKKFIAFYPQKNGFICQDCYLPAYDDATLRISPASAGVFATIMQIGNVLDEIEISSETIKQLNRIFLIHLSEHFHQNFHLKSLELYSNQ
ncbi:DNA repair protein RecO [Candidatus Cloacimonadota bacterium]